MKDYLFKIKRIHLVGIGGVGMMGLAFLLRDRGFIVSGSDIKESKNIMALRKEDFKVYVGHRRENIYGAQLLCYSSAVKEDNIEILEAKRKGIEVIKRAELLSWISLNAKNIVISGSHGKTTTSALIAFVLTKLGYAPNVFIGGISLDFGRYAWSGKDLFVIEADESDGSFLYYNPWIFVVTNIDYEHLDFYKSFENLYNSFYKLMLNTRSLTIGCGDDKNVRQLLEKVSSCSYGFLKSNTIRAENVRFYSKYTVFDLILKEKKVKGIELSLLGEHNVLNALAVISLCSYLGEDIFNIIPLLREFKGTSRRFQFKANIGGIIFVDDYAHHPTEISATLKAARQLLPKRLVVIIQPHRYSRVKLLYREFAKCFYSCDYLVVTDIYSAGETSQEGINGHFLAKEIKKYFSNVVYIPKEKLPFEVPLLLKEGDLVMGLGAGDINIIMDTILKEISLKTDTVYGY